MGTITGRDRFTLHGIGSALPQLRSQRLRLRSRCLTREFAAHVGSGAPLHQASVLKERNGGALSIRCSQSRDLEGLVAVANDRQQLLRIGAVGIADNGNLPRLRKEIRLRLQPLAKAKGILAHHAPTSGDLHLGQGLASCVDITKLVVECSQLQQDGNRCGVAWMWVSTVSLES